MGGTYGAICKKCGKKFEYSQGGGMAFHLLRCDKCGKEKEIGFDEIGEPHKKYIKGLSVPYSGATSEWDEDIQKNYPGEPISEEEYYLEVEKMVGPCNCGGDFKFDAPPRCPKCKSTEFEDDSSLGGVMYD